MAAVDPVPTSTPSKPATGGFEQVPPDPPRHTVRASDDSAAGGAPDVAAQATCSVSEDGNMAAYVSLETLACANPLPFALGK